MATTDLNDTTPRPDVPGSMDWGESADLPAQMSEGMPTLMPGIDTFLLPKNLAQCWSEFTAKDSREFLPNGQRNPTFDQQVRRKMLKFDKVSPLIIQGGTHNGDPMTAVFTSNPRPRGKKADPKTPWISDLAYLLGTSLGDKNRPTDPEQVVALINKYAGRAIQLKHGLVARCRPDAVRYIDSTVADASGQAVTKTIPDPNGTKGCGARYYTRDFKDPTTGEYDKEIQCKCGAVLRGFPAVDEFLPPVTK